ncbi:MAG: hypothetical protein AB1568_04985 [Thermodesulfobacteriota bacterium]
MMRLRGWLLVMGFALAIAVVPARGSDVGAHAVPGYLYRERTGEETREFSWTLERQGENILVTSREKEMSYFNLCRPDGETIRWRMQGPDTALEAEREGEVIVLRGRRRQEEISKQLTIREDSWRQPLSFSLRELVDSGRAELRFRFIRPDTLELLKMKAVRREQGLIPVPGGELRAEQVEVRMDGLLSGLWSCNYWFRSGDGLFLRYEGVHGLPGTPRTVIELIDRGAADPVPEKVPGK